MEKVEVVMDVGSDSVYVVVPILRKSLEGRVSVVGVVLKVVPMHISVGSGDIMVMHIKSGLGPTVVINGNGSEAVEDVLAGAEELPPVYSKSDEDDHVES